MKSRIIFFLFFDLIISAITLYSAYLLRFNLDIPSSMIEKIPTIFATIFILKFIFLYMFRVYFLIWRLVSLQDILNIIKAHIFSYGIFTAIVLTSLNFYKIDFLLPIPKSVIIIDFALSLGIIAILRMGRRLYFENRIPEVSNPTLIIGVDEGVDFIIKKARRGKIPYSPVAILDLKKDSKKINNYISNLKVYGIENLEKVVTNYGIKSVIVTKETSSLDALFENLKNLGVSDFKVASPISNKIKNVSIEDLLARHPKDLDLEAIQKFIEGKRILITGAGGSIGSELSKQVEKFGADEILLLDHSEYNLYQIGENLKNSKHKNYLLNIVNRDDLEKVFQANEIDLVLHSAAYKHVPLCEENIGSAIENNIFGSINVIDLAIEYEVPKVVIISTDKAVRPTNVMGATKRVVELYAQNVDSGNSEIGAVRFGNVLGSSGSVIPKFKKLIENNQPITVTHPDITRYFMLVSEACQLVLQTGTVSQGGEIFILDMGEPVKIVDLAEKMKKLYGKESLQIEFIGLRPGEKKFEELLISDAEMKTKYESIFVTEPTKIDFRQLQKDISKMLFADEVRKLEILKNIVPEFQHNQNLGN
ncbi:putative nucleoside-diphosphate sugar epimerase [Thiovulum sp. ES]|nr:putative nucleoside-diphosphate sugar epimerase [Thiovulum sp. ES]